MLSKSDLVVILDVINQCLGIRQPDDVITLFDKLKIHTDLSGILLCQQKSQALDEFPTSTVLSSGINHDWIEHYLANRFFEVDPILSAASCTDHPVLWSDVYGRHTDSRNFQHEASEFGLSEGLTAASASQHPHQAATIVSLISDDKTLTPRDRTILHNVIPHLTEALKNSERDCRNHNLTPREIEVLNWAKEGKSYWETSVILKISERTVKFHSQNIYRKLNVTTRAQSISKALRLGILEL